MLEKLKRSLRQVGFVLLCVGCAASGATAEPANNGGKTPRAPALQTGEAEAIFAGGCFWCMETAFEGVEGVLSSVSGYTGGKNEGPSYAEVSGGDSGHYEAVRVVYDPKRISYTRLLELFLHNVDPTQGDGQFCDRGPQYRSAIFVHDAEQRKLASSALDAAKKVLKQPLVTPILEQTPFFVAEDYHQDFFRTHAEHYKAYRSGCGRDARLREVWGALSGGH